jgi:hypothetical protein
MAYYFVNNDPTHNPGEHHEVHTVDCYWGKKVESKRDLGYYTNENEAVAAAKRFYFADADGCATCCPNAHRG